MGHQTSTSTFVKVNSLSRWLLSEKDGSERSRSPESLAEGFQEAFLCSPQHWCWEMRYALMPMLKIETVAQDLAEWIGGGRNSRDLSKRKQDLRDLKRGLTLKINVAASTGDLITSINFARLVPSLEREEAFSLRWSGRI